LIDGAGADRQAKHPADIARQVCAAVVDIPSGRQEVNRE